MLWKRLTEYSIKIQDYITLLAYIAYTGDRTVKACVCDEIIRDTRRKHQRNHSKPYFGDWIFQFTATQTY